MNFKKINEHIKIITVSDFVNPVGFVDCLFLFVQAVEQCLTPPAVTVDIATVSMPSSTL